MMPELQRELHEPEVSDKMTSLHPVVFRPKETTENRHIVNTLQLFK